MQLQGASRWAAAAPGRRRGAPRRAAAAQRRRLGRNASRRAASGARHAPSRSRRAPPRWRRSAPQRALRQRAQKRERQHNVVTVEPRWAHIHSNLSDHSRITVGSQSGHSRVTVGSQSGHRFLYDFGMRRRKRNLILIKYTTTISKSQNHKETYDPIVTRL